MTSKDASESKSSTTVKAKAVKHANPARLEKWEKFRRSGISYWSFVALLVLVALASVAEMLINSRALAVKYDGRLYFPVVEGFHPGTEFGQDFDYEADYRALQAKFETEGSDNWVVMPLVPYNAYESDLHQASPPPHAPDFSARHFLGTDTSGRDLLARLVFGFRTGVYFSFFLYLFSTVIGVVAGCLMGYYGGKFDLGMQRAVEIWSMMPGLYLIMIIASVVVPGFWMLLLVMVLFDWTSMTWQMRAEIYREKHRAYSEVARAMGASDLRIVFRHLLPNSVVPIIARLPFQMVGGISALTGLDYLGYGLPVPTPSWGELLKQGQASFGYAPWILLSPFCAIFFVLFLFTFFGEGIRDTLDPKFNSLKKL